MPPELFVKAALYVGNDTNDSTLIEVLAHESNTGLKWIEGMGAEFDLDKGVYRDCSAVRMPFIKTGCYAAACAVERGRRRVEQFSGRAYQQG